MTRTEPLPRRSGLAALGGAALLAACAGHPDKLPPAVAPSVDTGGTTDGTIAPMYRELMAIDLGNAAAVAAAQNLDIRQARERVAAAGGRYESSLEAVVPTASPGLAYGRLSGVNQSVTGQLMPANFSTFAPAVLVQLLLNPGQVIYDAIAAKKRLLATERQEDFVVMQTLRRAAQGYYDLVLAQERVSVARQAVAQAQELSRLTGLGLKAGTALPADAARASASLAAREQDLTASVNAFYQASIALTLTLHLDPTVTLVPRPQPLAQARLVDAGLDIGHMLDIAMQRRPDLQGARELAAASKADASAVAWGGAGPQIQGGYQIGGIQSEADGQSFDMQEQRRAYAGASFNLSLATLGRVRTADALERQALLDAQKKLDLVRAEVVSAAQDSATQATLVEAARREVDAATEALRLVQANYRVGNALLLEVLQGEDALSQARLHYDGAVVSYNKAQVDLLAALGQLDGNSLAGAPPAPALAERQ